MVDQARLHELEARLSRVPSVLLLGACVRWGVRRSAGGHEVLGIRTGDDGGTVVSRGEPARPTFSVSGYLDDLIDLLDGYANWEAMRIDGRLVLEGDLGAALRVLASMTEGLERLNGAERR